MTNFQHRLHLAATECTLYGYHHMAAAFRAMLDREIAEFGLDGEKGNVPVAGVVLKEDDTGEANRFHRAYDTPLAPSPSLPQSGG